ncbi:MAG: hypothetical protein ACFB03_19750 [Paracoccaceae bacterium]
MALGCPCAFPAVLKGTVELVGAADLVEKVAKRRFLSNSPFGGKKFLNVINGLFLERSAKVAVFQLEQTFSTRSAFFGAP